MNIPKRSGPFSPGVAFVTGAARGLGNAVAVAFAMEGARAVVIVDILDDKTMQAGKEAVQKYCSECITIQADISKEADVERAIEKAVATYGRIDYAANFAGILGPTTLLSDTKVEEFERCLAVNSIGVFLCTKHEIRQMKKQDTIAVEEGRVPQRGSIVNCASVNSILSGAGTGAYTTSKHGVVGITKAAALEARSHGIRVNAVSPGFLKTEIVADLVNAPKGFGGTAWTDFENRQGREASFAEVGDVVTLLSSPRMSLVNGTNLSIDGGFVINEGMD